MGMDAWMHGACRAQAPSLCANRGLSSKIAATPDSTLLATVVLVELEK